MKRILLIMLGMLLLCAPALGEDAPLPIVDLGEDTSLVFVVPEGVTDAAIEETYDMMVLTFTLEDDAFPAYRMVVSYSDLLHEQNMEDLSDADIEAITALTAADSQAHSYTVREMADGWPAVLIDYENPGEGDWVDAFTVIDGYLVQVHGAFDDFAALTDEEIEFAFTLLDSVDVVEATE